MKKIILGVLCLLSIAGCTTEKINGQQENVDTLATNKPQTKIIVNKEYDEFGNLVKFDSSYSYFYSNLQNDSTFGDSSYSLFQKDFFNSFPNIQKPFLNDIFFEDSLLNYDFYKDDFFSNRFRSNRKRFDKMFEEMDSLKNKFYKNYSQPSK
ncbi:MAG: hypothetical protein OQJ81_10320 [Melioribacteraceae bacterium]|nr:hypothetical protein [Melioribacteraceae bacterium]